jgi:neutral ceramidase
MHGASLLLDPIEVPLNFKTIRFSMKTHAEKIKSEDDNSQFFCAGAAKVDITPPLGTYINGDFVAHYARYIHDNLYAKALVMQKGGTMIAIVVVDICVMPKDFVDNVKSKIIKEIGIGTEYILISSTHTHAGGSVESVYLSPADSLYVKKLPDLILKAVQQAKQKLRRAKIAFGTVNVPQHVLCRRYIMNDNYVARNPVTGGVDQVKTNPFGAGDQIYQKNASTDPQVSFLALQDSDGKWISVFGNYSLHYVGDWDNGTITADYFGEFSRQLQDKLQAGDDFVGIMSNGTSGDVNIMDLVHIDRYPSQNFKKSQLIGGDIAEKVFQKLSTIEWQTDPGISTQYEEISLSVRKPSMEELEAARKFVAESDYENLEVTHDMDDGLQRIYAREQVLLNEFPDTLLFPVQAIRIGEAVIGGLGAEIFAETGLWLKENSPHKKYFTIGLANGNAGYVPPAHEIKKGGYETWRSRTSYLKENAENVIRAKLLELIQLV